MPGKVMSNGAASSLTVASPVASRARLAAGTLKPVSVILSGSNIRSRRNSSNGRPVARAVAEPDPFQ